MLPSLSRDAAAHLTSRAWSSCRLALRHGTKSMGGVRPWLHLWSINGSPVASSPGIRTSPSTTAVLNHWRLPLGNVIAGEYPGSPDITFALAKLTELLALGVTTIIDLTEPSEGLRDYGALLRTLPGGRFVHHLRCPIPDVSSTDTATLHRILDHIDVALSGEGTVYVHCWGGIGRTGMVAGAFLVRRGLPPSGALHVVNAAWRGTAKAKLAKHATRTSP